MGKKVTIESIDKIIKKCGFEKKVITYKCGDEDINIEVNPQVDIKDWADAINKGVSFIYDYRFDTEVNGENIIYAKNPEIYSVAYGFSLIKCFTNIKSENPIKVFNLVINTNIIESVCDIVGTNIINMFKIDFDKTVTLSEKASVFNGIVTESVHRISDTANKLGDIIERFSENDELTKLVGGDMIGKS